MLILFLSMILLTSDFAAAKQRMYQGVDVAKHVPTSVLASGSVVNVIDVHYR